MESRIYFLDYVRALACFMVIMVHSCEFFFIDGNEIGIKSLDDGFWVSTIDSAFRCSVPLFVMISAYLLVPVRGSVKEFFRRRLVRVVVPFAVWSLLYATLPALWGEMSGREVVASILHLAYNFNDAAGHFWFIYMLIGLYLFMPVISPWLEAAGKRAEQGFLLFWVLASFFPYLRDAAGPVYGECYWNEFNILWYFSGFLGYVVLAHYVRRHLTLGRRAMICSGAALYIAGYLFTAIFWYGRIPTATTLQELELSWRFCTPNVIALSFGAFIVMKALFGERKSESKAIGSISRLSYGIYLMHILVLGAAYRLIGAHLPTLPTILTVGTATFLASWAIAKILSMLPGSRFTVGS